MQDIIIVCAGSVATEVYSEIELINKFEIENGRSAKYRVLGFIDDNPNALNDYPYVKASIIGDISSWQPVNNEKYVLGVASPKTKEKLVNILTQRGCDFETIISPYSKLRSSVVIGKGCFISAYSISAGAKIGNYVSIMGSMIGGESIIGDFCTTLGFANVANGKLGKSVYVGSHAVVLDVIVEDDAFISVGSIVVRKVKAGTKVFGYPAKRIEI